MRESSLFHTARHHLILTPLRNTGHLPREILCHKHGRWKIRSCWRRLQYWRCEINQPARGTKFPRYCCPHLLQVHVYIEGTQASNHLWTSILPAVHRTTDKWRVSWHTWDSVVALLQLLLLHAISSAYTNSHMDMDMSMLLL